MEGRESISTIQHPWRRVFLLCSAYTFLLYWLLSTYGITISSLAIIPALLASLYAGRKHGIVTAGFVILMNAIVLIYWNIESHRTDLISLLPSTMAVISITFVAGWLTRVRETLQLTYQKRLILERNCEEIINSAPNPIITLSAEGIVDVYNQEAEQLFGIPYEEISGQCIQHLSDALWQQFKKRVETISATSAVKHREVLVEELILTRADGHTLPVEFTISEQHHKESRRFTLVARDLTERKRTEAAVDRLQYYDSLTGVANRAKFNVICQRLIAESTPFTIFLLNINGFKRVNDSLGHFSGDQLLKRVVERLAGRLRTTDHLFRLGGDEFLLLFPELADTSTAATLANRLLAVFSTPFVELVQKPYLTTGLGVCVFPLHGQSTEELLRNANTALSRAKLSRLSDFQVYSPNMKEDLAEHLSLATALLNAVERNELTLEYQPQFSGQNGKLTGVEALLRWHSPELGAVSPARFVPVAESNGLIVPLGEWVLRMACMQLKRWENVIPTDFCVAINLSALQFNHPDLASMIAQVLTETGVNPKHIELEITESMAIMDVEKAIVMMNKLRSLGLKLAIDDFGTGHSSLLSLKRYPLDRLKLDKSLVQDLGMDPSAAAVTSAIITLAHGMGLEAIAEGVERVEQQNSLREQGCNYLQGFLLGRPVPATVVEKLLQPN